MMLPRALEVFEELELELLLRSAIELSMKDEMIDCADAAPVEEVALDVVAELGSLPDKAPTKFWNAALRLEVTLLEAPEPPSKLDSSSLFPDSVARLVSAATVEATLAGELAVAVEGLLAPAAEATEFGAERAEAWMLPTLPIDIICSAWRCWKPCDRPAFAELEKIV